MKNGPFIYFIILLGLYSCGVNVKNEIPKLEDEIAPRNQLTVIDELNSSPRHQEWITLSRGDRKFQAYVVYPENSQKTKAVIVIHENRGLDDWARLFADKLAAQGYLAIAPDLISNTMDGNNRTSDFENPDAAREAIYSLDPGQVTGDLTAAYDYIKNDPSSTGQVAVVGFCWGGSQAFRFATNNDEITAAHVFYGSAPKDREDFSKISIPIYGYYGGEDHRVNATIDPTVKVMAEYNNIYDYVIYEGAGHAFMKRAHEPEANVSNKKAHDAAWDRLLNLLKKDR